MLSNILEKWEFVLFCCCYSYIIGQSWQ